MRHWVILIKEGGKKMNTGKIIFVDDDAALLNCFTELLTTRGFTVYPFSNGLDALDKFLDEPVDVVLTDIKMPMISGIDLLRKIHAIDPETPVILATGYERDGADCTA